MTIQVTDSGKCKIGSLNLDFYGGQHGKIYFNVTDHSKFMYENGYQKKGISRVLTKNKTIRYAGCVLDLSKVNGIQNV